MATNIDGDSDSTGSIAGNLAGARGETSAIPQRWLASLELRDVIDELAGDLYDCTDWGLADTADGLRTPQAERH